MNVRKEICDLLDRGEKGYITIGDVRVAIFHIAIMVAATHLVYCSIPIWQTSNNPTIVFMGNANDFSFYAQIGYLLSWTFIFIAITICCVLLLSKLEDISSIKIIKCRRKQK